MQRRGGGPAVKDVDRLGGDQRGCAGTGHVRRQPPPSRSKKSPSAPPQYFGVGPTRGPNTGVDMKLIALPILAVALLAGCSAERTTPPASTVTVTAATPTASVAAPTPAAPVTVTMTTTPSAPAPE